MPQTKLTVYRGPKITDPQFNQAVYEWGSGMRDDKYAASKPDVIDKAGSINPSFHYIDPKKFFDWVHRFISCINLTA